MWQYLAMDEMGEDPLVLSQEIQNFLILIPPILSTRELGKSSQR